MGPNEMSVSNLTYAMSNFTTKQPKIKPSDVFPGMVQKVVRIKVKADELLAELSNEELGEAMGITPQSMSEQVLKYKNREKKA